MTDSNGAERLSVAQVQANLIALPDWTLEPDGRALGRTYQFTDFVSAVRFMMRVAPRCELMGHYPAWTNLHTRLEARLTTPACSGVSHIDLALAAYMDQTFSGALP